jgi:two-component system response regulator LytT
LGICGFRGVFLKFKDKHRKTLISSQQIEALMSMMTTPRKTFKSSFLVRKKDTFIPIASQDFAFFFIQNGIVRGTTKDDQTFSFSEKLEDLENDLNPELFFRANRQYLIQRSAIKSLETYFNGRIVVNLQPRVKDRIIVSKANASKLKSWLQNAKKISP